MMLWRDLFNRAAVAAETDDRLLTADRRFKKTKAIGAERRLFIFIRRQSPGNYSARPGRKTAFPNPYSAAAHYNIRK
jgi:hypothetical protein